MLARHVPFGPAEEAARARTEEFVRSNPQCFENLCEAGHLTCSAWLLDPSRQRVLLTHHRKLNRWLQLGGHADGDPDVLAAAIREAQEESGIELVRPLSEGIFDIGVHDAPAHDGMGRHEHFDVRFLLHAYGSNEFVISDESISLAWLTPEEVEAMDVDDDVRRMNAKWQRDWRGID